MAAASAKGPGRFGFSKIEGLAFRIYNVDHTICRLFVGSKNTTCLKKQGFNFPALKVDSGSCSHHEPPKKL
jgi:hypothetical protein